MDHLKLKRFNAIECLEEKYLKKYFHFLKFAEDEMMEGFKTKEYIKEDWIEFWKANEDGKSKLSDFAVGAERIVYALLNGKCIGQPNSSPVGSDLFFEVSDAFIHIDMKTVRAENSCDFADDIFVGENQNSYKGTIIKQNGVLRPYTPCLPTYYHPEKDGVKLPLKPCLSFFVTILYEWETLDILVLSIICMPNGELEPLYGSRPLKPGKNIGKTRFNFSQVPYFESFKDKEKHPRIKVVYFKEDMDPDYLKRLSFYHKMYKNQKD